MATAPTDYHAYLQALQREAERAELVLLNPHTNWISTPDIGPKSHIGISIAQHGVRGIRVSLTNMQDADRAIFNRLMGDAEAIGAEITPELDWANIKPLKKSTVRATLECDVTDSNDWNQQHRWITDTVREFIAAFEPRLNSARQ